MKKEKKGVGVRWEKKEGCNKDGKGRVFLRVKFFLNF
jgi:hypothetical protein